MNYSWSKEKKLKSRKSIERLFSEGKKLNKFPLLAIFHFEPNEEKSIKTAVSVPKKKFKKAVDRNLLKRRMREAIRLNQNELTLHGKLEIMFIYTSGEILKYAEIEKSIKTLIADLNLISDDSTEASQNKV